MTEDDAAKNVRRITRALAEEQGGTHLEPPRRERQFPRTESTDDVLHVSKEEKRWPQQLGLSKD